MSDQPHNEPAFPFHYDAGGPYPNYVSGKGMTLREYMAAKAMQGLIAGAMADGSTFELQAVPLIAKGAYLMADAMLKEGDK